MDARPLRWRSLLAACALALIAPGAAHAVPPTFPDHPAFAGDFASLAPDSLHTAHLTSVLLQRGPAAFALTEGRVTFARPVGGRVVAAVYSGSGTFSYTPPDPIERRQLERYYDSRSLQVPVRSIVFVWADSTGDELRSIAAFGPDTLARVQRNAFHDALRYLTSPRFGDAMWVTSLGLLERQALPLFYAHVVDERGHSYFFRLNPFEAERAELLRPPEDDRIGLWRTYRQEPVCKTALAGDPPVAEDDRPTIVVTHMDLDVDFDAHLDSRVRAALTLQAVDGPRSWFPFAFFNRYDVDSISIAGRAPIPVEVRDRNHNTPDVESFLVPIDPPLAAGDTATLVVHYRGRLFDRENDQLTHRAPFAWYPRPIFVTPATWAMHFRYPKEYVLIASGDQRSDEADGNFRRAEWRIDRPSSWASFDLDFLRGVEVTDATLDPLRVWVHRRSKVGQLERRTMAGLANAKTYEDQVARDVARALHFYEEAFGPPPVRSLNALETALPVYVAYPGLTHMMLKADQLLAGAAYSTDFLRAHELSHQWWGLGARPRTYHDAWLSEGFADFCAIWYMQASRRDPKSYFEVLREWKRQLLENRNFPLGGGQQAGPIWLGRRTNSSSTVGDYDLIVYNKGAWVLHMLRNVLLDLDHADESRFRALMHDFYVAHRDTTTDTEAFRAAVERAAGEDMGWFFDQWVYGTDVPTYRVAWTTESEGDQWRVRLRIEQSKVPDSFRMPVPVRLDFGGDEFARSRVWVTGPVTEVTLPPLPRKPEKVVFNDLESVLCDVQTAAWK